VLDFRSFSAVSAGPPPSCIVPSMYAIDHVTLQLASCQRCDRHVAQLLHTCITPCAIEHFQVRSAASAAVAVQPLVPVLHDLGVIVSDPTACIRDPTQVVRYNGTWHFWATHNPSCTDRKSFPRATVHHYFSATDDVRGPWNTSGEARYLSFRTRFAHFVHVHCVGARSSGPPAHQVTSSLGSGCRWPALAVARRHAPT
jgi:hypothetical protein